MSRPRAQIVLPQPAAGVAGSLILSSASLGQKLCTYKRDAHTVVRIDYRFELTAGDYLRISVPYFVLISSMWLKE